MASVADNPASSGTRLTGSESHLAIVSSEPDVVALEN